MPIIRPAEPADASALATLATTVFTTTYGTALPSASLQRYVAQIFSQAALLADLTNTNHTYFVAVQAEQLIGFSQLTSTPTPSCVAHTPAIELARFYVTPEQQGRGVAGPLLEASLAAAWQSGSRAVWLCVWEKNARALAFYQKWGFALVGKHDIVIEETIFHDHIFVRNSQ